MSELRFTDTNSSDDSAGRVFGLQGDLYLWPVIAAAVGVGLFAGLTLALHAGGMISGLVSAVPLGATVGWIVLLKHGRPAGYDRDWLEQVVSGGGFSRRTEGKVQGREHDRAPDGYFVDDMLVFGSPERGGVVARGFWIEPADQRGASNEHRNALQEKLRNVLVLVGAGRRLQVQWWPDSDYAGALLRYHERTQAEPEAALRRVRNERFARYWSRIEGGNLRRERLAVFLSIEIGGYTGNLRDREGAREGYGVLLRQMAAQFEEFANTVRTILGPETPVRLMTDADHYRCYRRILNPGWAHRAGDQGLAGFDPERTLQENCLTGEAVPQPGGGFHLDGCYHAILTLDRWPKQTRPGIVTHLTGLPFPDYAITVNLTPALTRQEIHREEKAAERLRGEYADNPRASVLVALQKKERKVQALSGGFARPFQVTYLLRVWAPTVEGLREKVSAVKAAVQAMDGAQSFECSLPTTARKLFFASWPGWTYSSYHHRELYGEDSYLPDVLPCSATFTGALDDAEALYDGSHGNLVGVTTQIGGSPQHTVLLGMTGAGKSAFVQDLLWQTATYFPYTFLVEEGYSYKAFTEAMGETPIVIHPDAAITFNYLDTQGLPLSQLHLATAGALLARMSGTPEDALALAQAQLTQYLHQLYRDTFTDWSRRNPRKADEARRLALGVQRWRERMAAGTTPLEAFTDLRDRLRKKEDEATTLVSELSEADITRFAQEPATERMVAQTACAFYEAEDYPTHSALVELLAYARLPEHDKAEVDRLATLLRAWCAEGAYGRLFDGVTNVSLRRRIVHFELGFIPEQAVELKAAAGLLISGIVRQHIIGLRRDVRKRVVFEELSRFLDVPGGEAIVAESYAQLRKFNCWAISIVQQYARFRASRIRPAVIGNAKQFLLMRQNDRQDLVQVAEDLGLPEAALEGIQQYPLPEQQAPENRYSSVCYFIPGAQPPQCGTLRHIQAREADHA